MIMQNIYPIFSKMQSREEKEKFLGQKGLTLWFTGLSGSGKSTVAIALERALSAEGILCRIIDGDNVRTALNSDLGFSAEDRVENIRRIAEVCKLFTHTGIVTLATFISPTRDLREMARNIIGKDDFMEIYISTPLSECEKRDVKGLYAKARNGEIQNFTGVSAPFEEPISPDARIDTSKLSLEESVLNIMKAAMPRIKENIKNI